MIDWELISNGCLNCGAKEGGPRGLHWHSLSVWCLRCGWSKNWVPEKRAAATTQADASDEQAQ